MKRLFIPAFFLLLSLLAGFAGSPQPVIAAERTVQLTIPGCNT